MFDAKNLPVLDPKYFSIIFTDTFDVTVMSWNIGHYWFIHNLEYPTTGTCIIFHKHRALHPYHQRGYANSLKQAALRINVYWVVILLPGAGFYVGNRWNKYLRTQIKYLLIIRSVLC